MSKQRIELCLFCMFAIGYIAGAVSVLGALWLT